MGDFGRFRVQNTDFRIRTPDFGFRQSAGHRFHGLWVPVHTVHILKPRAYGPVGRMYAIAHREHSVCGVCSVVPNDVSIHGSESRIHVPDELWVMLHEGLITCIGYLDP